MHGFLCLDRDVLKGYQNICATFKVKGNIPEEIIHELLEISSAYSVVTNKVPVSVRIQQA